MATEAKIKEWAEACEAAGYEVVGEKVKDTCGRCGGAGVFRCFGHIHNGKCFGCEGVGYRVSTIQKIAARIRRQAKAPAKRAAAAKARRQERAREIRIYIGERPLLQAALAGATNKIIRDIARNLRTYGSLTPKQEELVAKLVTQDIERAEEIEITPPEGRHTVEGEIIKIKEVPGYAYGQTDLKMIVKVTTDEGTFRLYGALPRALWGVDTGTKIRYTATIEPKEDGFGFFKRPTKAEEI